MLLKRLKLINYGGIYNGMGLYEIEIDFTRCMHRIVLIKGDNGSGKSTIESALKPLPDDNSSFISGMDASKEIEYLDELTGIVYSIKYIHEYKNNSRTSKGYFMKIMPDGNVINLNASGNISSCKEMVNEELELDANYITLTQLSSTKRGIADLRPAERKRYVNAILSSTDVYNTMYKNLSKKASTYKALMASISSKIDSVGNVTQLQEELKSVEAKVKDIEDMIEQHTEIINKEKGMLLSIDPNNELSNRIKSFTENTTVYTTKIDECNKRLNKIYSINPALITAVINQEILDKLNKDILDTKYMIDSLKEKIESLVKEREQEASRLEDETAKLKSINSGTSIIEIESIKDNLTNRKNNIKNRWGDIVDLDTITYDEFMMAYDIIKQMMELLSSIVNVIPEDSINREYILANDNISRIDTEIEEAISFRNKVEANEYKLDILEKRPSSCKDDTCPFIADALKAKVTIDRLLTERQNCVNSVAVLNKEKESYEQTLKNIEKNKQLLSMYNANKYIINKLQLGFRNYNDCITFLSRDGMKIITLLNGVMEYTNDLKEYKSIDKDLSDITNKYNSINSQKNLIDLITDSIDRLNNSINQDTETINNYSDQISSLTKNIMICVLFVLIWKISII